MESIWVIVSSTSVFEQELPQLDNKNPMIIMKMKGNLVNDLILLLSCMDCKPQHFVCLIMISILSKKSRSGKKKQHQEEEILRQLCIRVAILWRSLGLSS